MASGWGITNRQLLGWPRGDPFLPPRLVLVQVFGDISFLGQVDHRQFKVGVPIRDLRLVTDQASMLFELTSRRHPTERHDPAIGCRKTQSRPIILKDGIAG